MGGSHEVWPELGFGDYDEVGLQGVEVLLHTECKIEWEVEDAVCAEAANF